AKININNPDQMHLFIEEEEKMLVDMVSQIEKTGANIVFSEKGIDDVALHYLAKKGIGAVKNVSSGDIEKLSKATGARVVASVKDLAKDAVYRHLHKQLRLCRQRWQRSLGSIRLTFS